jgi:hypothetical protein
MPHGVIDEIYDARQYPVVRIRIRAYIIKYIRKDTKSRGLATCSFVRYSGFSSFIRPALELGR